MPLKDASGETEAHIFYMAYTLDGVADAAKRPLTFAFNGGPGSASIWVHMGAMGPRKREAARQRRHAARRRFSSSTTNTPGSTQTDLVFIDPVGTGYSRAKNADVARG